MSAAVKAFHGQETEAQMQNMVAWSFPFWQPENARLRPAQRCATGASQPKNTAIGLRADRRVEQMTNCV
jgi:hypothetical protein